MAESVEAQHYKPDGQCFTSRSASGTFGTGICDGLNPSGRTVALGSTQPDRNEYQEYFLRGAEAVGAWSRLPCHLSCFDILEIWETQPPGTFRALPGLYRDCFTLLTSNIKFNVLAKDSNNSLFSYIMCGRSEKYSIKIICYQGFYSTSMNILSTAPTYIAFSSVWAFKTAPFLRALPAEMCIPNVKCNTSHQF